MQSLTDHWNVLKTALINRNPEVTLLLPTVQLRAINIFRGHSLLTATTTNKKSCEVFESRKQRQ